MDALVDRLSRNPPQEFSDFLEIIGATGLFADSDQCCCGDFARDLGPVKSGCEEFTDKTRTKVGV